MKDFPNQKQEIGSKSCGPVCLLNVYRYFGIKTELKDILKELRIDDKTTTYPAQLASHLLSNGLKTVFINTNPFVVSPSWKNIRNKELVQKLTKWLKKNKKGRWEKSAKYLLKYLKKGGEIKICDLSTKMIDEYMAEGYLLICCLEESWIWGERKIKGTNKFDDIKGEPRGHFIILYDKEGEDYLVSDPYPTGLKNRNGLYKLDKNKLLAATLVWTGQIVAVKKT